MVIIICIFHKVEEVEEDIVVREAGEGGEGRADEEEEEDRESLESWFDNMTSFQTSTAQTLLVERSNTHNTPSSTMRSSTPSKPKKQSNLKCVTTVGSQKKVLHIENGLLKCDVCSFSTETFSRFQQHLKNKCVERSPYMLRDKTVTISPSKFRCVGCPKEFPSSPQLRKHIKTHGGIVACRICGLRFRRYHALNMHTMNVHMEDTGGGGGGLPEEPMV